MNACWASCAIYFVVNGLYHSVVARLAVTSRGNLCVLFFFLQRELRFIEVTNNCLKLLTTVPKLECDTHL